MADHIAEYCEAYLITSGLCKARSKCCVPRDSYPDKPPADLRIPNGHQNQTTLSKPTKSAATTSSNAQQRPKPPMKPNTSRPTKPQEPSRESEEGNKINHRPCNGECVSGLFALFCDALDDDAFCPNDGSCCVSSAANNAPPTTPKPVSTFCMRFADVFLG